MKIPKKVMGLGGVIRIVVKPKVRVKNESVAGAWHPLKRKIEISESTPSDMRHTYYHELTHAALDDSGQGQLLTKEGAEALCDLIAQARLREEESK